MPNAHLSTILVTGGCGFIGSNLTRTLVREKGVRVVNVDKLTYAGNQHSLSDIADHDNYTFEHADICDRDALQKVLKLHQPSSIIHLAAESHVDRSIDGPDEAIKTNLLGTFQLLEATRDYAQNSRIQDVKFLQVSTDEVYGSLAFDEPGFSEETSYAPHSPYSATKAGSDHLVRAWHHSYGLPALITNCSNNYGPYQFPEKLIPLVILKCIKGDKIPVYGTGENIRDWLYVGDHVNALMAVLEHGTIGETYNIGGQCEMSNIDLVTQVCTHVDELTRCPEPCVDLIRFVEDRPGHDLRYAMDTTKIESELGWKPKETFPSGLRKTVEWYLQNRTWWEPLVDKGNLNRRGLGQHP